MMQIPYLDIWLSILISGQVQFKSIVLEWASPEKDPKWGELRTYLFGRALAWRFLGYFFVPLEVSEKTKPTPRNSVKLCYIPLKC